MALLTGLSDDRELAAQRALNAALATQFSAGVAREIVRASTDMLRVYEATSEVPAIGPDDAMRMRDIYAGMALTATRAFGARIVTQGKAYSPALERKDLAGFSEFFARLAQEWMAYEEIRARISSVTDTTRAQLIALIQRGQADGEGTAVIARRISERIPQLAGVRAEVIARTEIHGASNYAADRTARATGLQMDKKWLSADDARTRDFGEGDAVVDEFNHREMHGQIVPMDGLFVMRRKGGGEVRCAYPGDASLPVGAVVRCRCGVGHIVGGLD